MEDNDQAEAGQAVMNLLLAAGYFRARIKGLNDFDKVVGGLVWCLQSCEFGVDVDLSFSDDGLNVGEKISLTEKIVSVLRNISDCRHMVEPHQIQGLDFVRLYPLFQWLVKRMVETKGMSENFSRIMALRKFNRDFEGGEVEERHVTRFVRSENSPPVRKYRQVVEQVPFDIASAAEMTLMEYDKSVNVQEDPSPKEGSKLSCRRLEPVAPPEDDGTLLENQGVNELVQVELDKAHEQYVKLQREYQKNKSLNDPLALGKRAELAMKMKQETVSKMLLILEEIQGSGGLQDALEKTKGEMLKKEMQLNNILTLSTATTALTKQQRGDLKLLKGALDRKQNIKNEETEFRKKCQKELILLVERNNALKNMLSSTPQEKLETGDGGNVDDMGLLDSLRSDLAHKNYVLNELERKLDMVPSTRELAQYQKRFMELEDLVALEYSETQRYMALYNALVDERSFLEKQVTLLESVRESAPDAKYATFASKLSFVEQLSRLDLGGEKALEYHKKVFDEQREKLSEIQLELIELVEERRRYEALLKTLDDEIRQNQELMKRLGERQVHL